MREIHTERKKGLEHLLKKVPDKIIGELIDEPCIVYENGKPVLGYFFYPPKLLDEVTKAARSVKLVKNHRTWGLPTQSVVLGAMPRHSTMNDYCRFTKQSKTELENFKILLKALNYADEQYQRFFPEHHEKALLEVSQTVDKSWRFNDSPYLTINVNVNHAIKYHRDSGNFSSALSTVLIAKENIKGGELCCPELGLTLSQRHGALTLFEGQSLTHGVRPIAPTSGNAMRASIVFYSMANLKHCYPYAEEFNRAKKLTTEKAKANGAEKKLLLAAQAKAVLERKLGEEGYQQLIKKLKLKKGKG